MVTNLRNRESYTVTTMFRLTETRSGSERISDTLVQTGKPGILTKGASVHCKPGELLLTVEKLWIL